MGLEFKLMSSQYRGIFKVNGGGGGGGGGYIEVACEGTHKQKSGDNDGTKRIVIAITMFVCAMIAPGKLP